MRGSYLKLLRFNYILKYGKLKSGGEAASSLRVGISKARIGLLRLRQQHQRAAQVPLG